MRERIRRRIKKGMSRRREKGIEGWSREEGKREKGEEYGKGGRKTQFTALVEVSIDGKWIIIYPIQIPAKPDLAYSRGT